MMRSFSVEKYSSSAKDLFEFLLKDYKCKLSVEKQTGFSFIHEYECEDSTVRIHLNYDFRDNFFYFCIILGKDTIFPNDADNLNIKPFYVIFKESNLVVEPRELQPDDKQYLQSLRLNAELLKKCVKHYLCQ